MNSLVEAHKALKDQMVQDNNVAGLKVLCRLMECLARNQPNLASDYWEQLRSAYPQLELDSWADLTTF